MMMQLISWSSPVVKSSKFTDYIMYIFLFKYPKKNKLEELIMTNMADPFNIFKDLEKIYQNKCE